MCIIMYLPVGKNIDTMDIKRAHKYNNHGYGLAYVNNDAKVQIFKTMKLKEFIREFRNRQQQFPESPFLLHLRKKTDGKVNIDNAHPFWINENQVFMHNGTIYPEKPEKEDGDKSDTRLFNENVLKHLPFGWEYTAGCRRMIEHYLGRSRIVLLDNQKTVTIFNEFADGTSGKAHWGDNGVWYSNEYYKKDYTPPADKKDNWWGRSYGNYYNDYDDDWTNTQFNEPNDFVTDDPASPKYKPKAAGWYGKLSSRWMRTIDGKQHAWSWETQCWRPWDVAKMEFTDNKVIQLPQDTKTHTIKQEKCESCRCYHDWYDVKRYKDDFQGHHMLCFKCAKEYRDVGFNLTIDHNKKEAIN